MKALEIMLGQVGCGWPKISQDAELPITISSWNSWPGLGNCLYPNKPISSHFLDHLFANLIKLSITH